MSDVEFTYHYVPAPTDPHHFRVALDEAFAFEGDGLGWTTDYLNDGRT